MFNIPDPWVLAAFLLSLASSVLCVVWGICRWNEEDSSEEPMEEIRHLLQEEDKVEEKL